jgi:hypothetical protein
MKKLLTLCSFALLSLGASAQAFDPHFGIGVGVGTTGIDIDASLTINKYIGLRGGVDIMPKIKVKTDIDLGTKEASANMAQLTSKANEINAAYKALHPGAGDVIDMSNPIFNNRLPEKMDVEGKLDNTLGHVLLDIHPFGTSFRLTVGAYFGKDEIVSVYNKEEGFLSPITQWNEAIRNPDPSYSSFVANQEMIGAKIGKYFITPNPADKGNVEANIKVNKFRPYVGLGFGRAVPKKRIGCQFDLGVQFWGKPEILAPTYDNGTYKNEKIEEGGVEGSGGDAIKTISKISVYPVLNFRLVGRIF